MNAPKKSIPPTLEEAIAHFDSVAKFTRENFGSGYDYEQYARFLKQLRFYEIAIAEGELVWKKKRKKKEEGDVKPN
jgi:hypothetical protein